MTGRSKSLGTSPLKLPTATPQAAVCLAERLAFLSRGLSRCADAERYLYETLHVACELTGSETGSILLPEPETGLLRFFMAPWMKPETLASLRFPIEGSFSGQCLTYKKPLLYHQDSGEELIRPIDDVHDLQPNSLLAVPILYQQEPLGILETFNRKDQSHYTGEDVVILEILASLAATFLQAHTATARLQHAYRELQGLDRMKSNFIAIASHELRTPLGVVLGHASVLRDLLQSGDPALYQQSQSVVDGALRLKDIIEDLSNANRFTAGPQRLERHKFTINPVILEVVEAFRAQAQQRHVALLLDLPDRSGIIEGEPEKIRVALSNLLKNALMFTNAGGHVLVSVENLPGYVQVSIVDDGVGIPAKDLERVFDRFYQVEEHMTRRHGGLGLGLSVAKTLIELHGGQIWVESVVGRGSNFSFLLPGKGGTEPKSVAAFILE